MRFLRDYELIITLVGGEVVKIIPEIRVQFEINKSVRGGLNNCTIKIYNLSEDKRKKLVKDKEQKDLLLPFEFKAGYDRLETIFKGNIFEAVSVRQGTDFITTISTFDGGFDYRNSFTSKTVTSNDPKQIIDDMPNTELGKVTERKELVRPKVLVGNSAKLIEDNLEDGETYFIDDGKLHIIKDDEVLHSGVSLVDASTGLLNTPIRKNREVTFNTLLNPTLKIGCLIQLVSTTATHLNGVYKIVTIKYKGDNYGSDWEQEVLCKIAEGAKVL